MKPLFKDTEWSFSLLNKTWDVIKKLAVDKYGLDFYDAQIEVISADQMIDACAAHAMPIMYDHWSFGKTAAKMKRDYQNGTSGLAYEVVINTDPCIAYLMENNDMVMQTLVMAHAAVGHSSFFKTNYLFKEHTNSKSIIDYLKFARDYVSECEKAYGINRVEKLLDKCHALQYQSVDRYPRVRASKDTVAQRAIDKAENERLMYDHLMEMASRRIYKSPDKRDLKRKFLEKELPEDNLLYFIEKHSITLESWEREIVRIVRIVGQYFYPQILTKTGNEGTATFWHYTLMHDLCDEGYLTEGHRLNFLTSHGGVIYQQQHAPMNPYTLGFSMFKDCRRICENPTAEDKEHMPQLIGKNWIDVVKDMTASYKDVSLISNFLSPKVVRDLKLFILDFKKGEDHMEVVQTHDTYDFRELRHNMSQTYEWDHHFPSVRIVSFDPTTPTMKIEHKDFLGRKLETARNSLVIIQNAISNLMGTNVEFV